MLLDRIYNLEHHQKTNNYGILLLTLLSLITFPALSGIFNLGDLLFDICFTVMIVAGVYIVTYTKTSLLTGLLLGIVIIISTWAGSYGQNNEIAWQSVRFFFVFFFFGFIGYHLFHSLRTSSRVTLNIIMGAVAGYLLLGIYGGLSFLFLESVLPGSFSDIDPQNSYDLYYHSFVTLTTLGYGDITPANSPAKAAAILFSLAGQLYITIVIALLIGKYLSDGGN